MKPKAFLFKGAFLILAVFILIFGGYALWDEKTAVLTSAPPRKGMPSAHSTSTAAALPVARILGGDSTGFAKAIEPRAFEFPNDHGAHPDFRNEWWYFTGNLETPQGRHFGYQFTLFRAALSSQPVLTSSHWATNQIFMGHLAITDSESKKFHHFERFSRTALELAGAQSQPFRVWLENWSVSSQGENFWPIKIQAQAGNVSLELELTSEKKLILQGNQGLSQKGHQPGNASYYYSFTRLKTKGQLRLAAQNYQLAGASWMDREWSTSALEDQQSGWDWFALQLSNGWELMFYQLRLKNGQIDTTSSGVLVAPDGQSFQLDHQQISVQNLKFWKSPSSGIVYPAQWELSVPERQIKLRVRPRLAQQEFTTSFTYWEGAVQVEGQFQKQTIEGQGYVEMTGYPKEDP